MHREFCTLFDSNYLIKFVAMHQSLLARRDDFRITAFCFDEYAEHMLQRLQLPCVETVALAALEAHDQALLSTKAERTAVEYCWTATPALPLFMLEVQPALPEITYIDADLMFFADPEPLFEEMGKASILITPHRYPPLYRHHEIHGRYNVQFLTFRNDDRARTALGWWHDRCIEWCYNRLEDGKLGDQKYLDDWPARFPGVHELRHKGGGLAPWNLVGHQVRSVGSEILVDDDPIIFFHYHKVRLHSDSTYSWRAPGFKISGAHRQLLYEPYFRALARARALINAVEPGFAAGVERPPRARDRLRMARIEMVERMIILVPVLSRMRGSG